MTALIAYRITAALFYLVDWIIYTVRLARYRL